MNAAEEVERSVARARREGAREVGRRPRERRARVWREFDVGARAGIPRARADDTRTAGLSGVGARGLRTPARARARAHAARLPRARRRGAPCGGLPPPEAALLPARRALDNRSAP